MASLPARYGMIYMAGFFTWIFLCPFSLLAQPSGGPYGPVAQTYELPETPGKYIMLQPMAWLQHQEKHSPSLQPLKPSWSG